jgi:hypothetical protein
MYVRFVSSHRLGYKAHFRRQAMMTSPMFGGSRERVYGILSGLEHAHALSEQLQTIGLQGLRIRVLTGVEGTRELDQHGENDGLVARLMRSLHLETEERGHVDEYAWALRQGQVVVEVHLPPRSEKTAVHAAFKLAQARFVHHYGTWMVQKLAY